MSYDITANSLDKQYDDLKILDEVQLDAAYNDLNNFANTQLRLNLLQLAKECHGNGSDAQFDSDGNANFTASLFNKQTGSRTYNGGDVSIGTSADGAYADADAANLSITFTPERPGKYAVEFIFTHLIILNATAEGQCETSFRITDGTTFSPGFRAGGYNGAPAANNTRILNIISIPFFFDWADTTQRTVKLQKFNRVCTQVNTNQVAASAANGEFYAKLEKI
jgi:hypothetical protein